MRCHVCDRTLSETEVSYSQFHDEFDPCGTCLTAIADLFNDSDEEEITEMMVEEWGADYILGDKDV